jgi:hypothetical protein
MPAEYSKRLSNVVLTKNDILNFSPGAISIGSSVYVNYPNQEYFLEAWCVYGGVLPGKSSEAIRSDELPWIQDGDSIEVSASPDRENDDPTKSGYAYWQKFLVTHEEDGTHKRNAFPTSGILLDHISYTGTGTGALPRTIPLNAIQAVKVTRVFIGVGGGSGGDGDVYEIVNGSLALSYGSAASKVYALQPFKDLLFAGLSNGDIYEYDGSTWSLSTLGSTGEAEIRSFAPLTDTALAGTGTAAYIYRFFQGTPPLGGWSIAVRPFDGVNFETGTVYSLLAINDLTIYVGLDGNLWLYDDSEIPWALQLATTETAITGLAEYNGIVYVGAGTHIFSNAPSVFLPGSFLEEQNFSSAGDCVAMVVHNDILFVLFESALYRYDGTTWTNDANILVGPTLGYTALASVAGVLYYGAYDSVSGNVFLGEYGGRAILTGTLPIYSIAGFQDEVYASIKKLTILPDDTAHGVVKTDSMSANDLKSLSASAIDTGGKITWTDGGFEINDVSLNQTGKNYYCVIWG